MFQQNFQNALNNSNNNSNTFMDSPLLYSSLVQLKEVGIHCEHDSYGLLDGENVRSLLIGLESAAPQKVGIAGKHDAGGKSKPYAAWGGLKWRAFSELYTTVPPVPASVGGMRVSITKPLLDLCEKVCSKLLVPELNYTGLVKELLTLEEGVLDDSLGVTREGEKAKREVAEEKMFKAILQSDGRRAKEKIHEFILKTGRGGSSICGNWGGGSYHSSAGSKN